MKSRAHLVFLLTLALVFPLLACQEDDDPNIEVNTPPEAPSVEDSATRAWEYLLTRYNVEDEQGVTWGPETMGSAPAAVGVNGLLLTALMVSPIGRHPDECGHTSATLEAILNSQDPTDGAFVSPVHGSAVYETAASLMALSHAVRLSETWRQREDVQEAIRSARHYILLTQIDDQPEFEGDFLVESPEDESLGAWYGGWGYGRENQAGKAPGNMSTVNLAATALHDSISALPPTPEESEAIDAAWNRLQGFLQRCQNLEENQAGGPQATHYASEASTPEETQYGTDGGAMYSPGYSKAGYEEGQGGLMVPRSYGSMTYSLLRCYLYTGLSAQDPRVRAAVDWVTQADHFTFDYNPGMPADQSLQGHYYYLHTAAYTLQMLFPDQDVLTDSNGEEHNWRQVLLSQLLADQREDGYWANPADRWFESNPVLVTAYALLTMASAAE